MMNSDKVLCVCGYCNMKVESIERADKMVLDHDTYRAYLVDEVMTFRPCGHVVYGPIIDYLIQEDNIVSFNEHLVQIQDPLADEKVVLQYFADPHMLGYDEDDEDEDEEEDGS